MTSVVSIATLPNDDRTAAEFALTNPVAESQSRMTRIALQDGEAALNELAGIEPPALRRQTSLALLGVFGRDLAAIDRITAALPPVEQLNFMLDAIASVAGDDPEAAIAMTFDLGDEPTQRAALIRIARTLSAAEPTTALAQIIEIESYELRSAYRAALVEHWANYDIDTFLSWIASANPGELRYDNPAFAIAASTDPEGLLSIVDTLPSYMQDRIRETAYNGLAASDPLAALARVDEIPAGQMRDRLLRSAAYEYALADPDAALAWLETVDSTSPIAATAVLRALAEIDPLRAIDVMIARLVSSEGTPSEMDAYQLPTFAAATPAEHALIAERLMGVDHRLVEKQLGSFLYDWAQDDHVATLDWFMTNISRLDDVTAWYVAQGISFADSELAMQTADRLPERVKGGWVVQVAGTVARDDFDRAMHWLSAYEDEAFHEDALRRALNDHLQLGVFSGANVDGPAVARLLEEHGPELTTSFASALARSWAGVDPEAAAQWAATVPLAGDGEDQRATSLDYAASTWAAIDARAARDWVLSLAPGPPRDAALAAELRITVGAGAVDTLLLNAFSSDLERQQALVHAMPNAARVDADLARNLINAYITDPVLRQQAEQALIEGVSSNSVNFGTTRLQF